MGVSNRAEVEATVVSASTPTKSRKAPSSSGKPSPKPPVTFSPSARPEDPEEATARHATPSQKPSASLFSTLPAARERLSVKVDFTKSLNLRLYRKNLLEIRDKLQAQVFRKYGNIRQLMRDFDIDGDGVVNESDWMYGIKAYNFPLTDDEARLMFRAIDENGDEMLTYKEMTDILEPATLTSWEPPAAADQMRDLTGFTKFSKKQTKQFAEGRAMTPSGTRLVEEVYNPELPKSPPPVDETLKRAPASIKEEVQILKERILKSLAKSGGDETTIHRFAKVFREMDTAQKHYLTHKEFLAMISGERFGIPLNDRQKKILVHEVADQNGAVDIKSFTAFLSREYVPIGDAMLEMTLRGREAMKRQDSLDLELDGKFNSTVPMTPDSHRKWTVPVSPVKRMRDTSAVGNPFMSSGGSGGGRGSSPSPSVLDSVRSARSASSRSVFEGPSPGTVPPPARSVHPLLTTSIDRMGIVGPSTVDPKVGIRGMSPARAVGDTPPMRRNESGLTVAAERLLNETRMIGVKPPTSTYNLAMKDDVKHTIRAPSDSAAYSSPDFQFKRKHDPSWYETKDLANKMGSHLRMARADRKLANEKRVMHAYEKQEIVANDADRRRVAAKRRQQLRYIANTDT